MVEKLKVCPICHTSPKIGYACGDYFVYCSDGCLSPMCDHASENAATCSWNDWAEWYEKNRCTEPARLETMLKKALELMYSDNKGYNSDGMGNPAYYIHQAQQLTHKTVESDG